MSTPKNAWLQLGTELQDTFSAADALERSGLAGWNLRKEPMHVDLGRGKKLEVPGRFAVLRDRPGKPGATDVLGDVGKSYQIIQNEELSGLLDAIAEESGARFETAGSVDDGGTVFATLRLPGHLRVGGRDPVDNFISVMTSHNGYTSTQVMVSPVQTAGQATLGLAYEDRPSLFRIRHTPGAAKALEEQAKDALNFAFDYLEAFQREAEELAARPVSQMVFEKLIDRHLGVPLSVPASTQTRTENKLDQMAKLFADGGDESAWGGLVALATWSDFHSPIRGAGPGGDQDSRSLKALLDPDFKNSALNLMQGA